MLKVVGVRNLGNGFYLLESADGAGSLTDAGFMLCWGIGYYPIIEAVVVEIFL